jgi:pyruvate formate lyase activating enzyme
MEPDPGGIIFDINRYAIHDGPGIRTTAFLKGCPLRCRWCANPESQSSSLELAHLKHECIQCGRCVDACPRDAIRLSATGHSIDRKSCDLCKKCVDTCPAEALQIIGRPVSAGDLYAEMATDRPFWERSGGGVTLSGGEPLIQHRFAKACLSICREKYVHTAIESCLHVSTEILNEIRPLVDHFICDLKIMDDRKHRRFTGVSNALIHTNMAILLRSDQDMLVRIPLIPGVNDDVENLTEMGNFLQSHREWTRLELLPHHRLGESKYERLGRTCGMADVPPPSKARMEKTAAILRNFKINLVKT